MIRLPVLLALFVILFAFHSGLYCQTEIARKVEEILVSVNVHHTMPSIEALVRLGKPAVPVLLQRLPADPHSQIILSALARLKDPYAVQPLLKYLSKLDLKGKKDLSSVRAVITTLSEIGDCQAEPDLQRLLMSPETHIVIRLYAATALVKIGSEPVRKQAEEFILHSPEIQKNTSVISPVDLDTAYYQVGNTQAINRLLHTIEAALPYEQLFIMDLFEANPNPLMIEGLLRTAEDAKYFPDVRFRAFENLARQKAVSVDRQIKILSSIRETAPEKGTGKSFVTKERIDKMIKKLSSQL